MTQGSSPRDLFREFARELLPQGVSGNLIIRGAVDAGIGIRRAEALGVIRELRAETQIAFPPAFEPPSIEVITGEPAFRWGELAQLTEQFSMFEGPGATLFQQNGPNQDEWMDYIALPEEEDYQSYRLVVADDNYIDANGRQPGFVTSQSFDVGVSFAEALGRLGITQAEVARIIYDR